MTLNNAYGWLDFRGALHHLKGRNILGRYLSQPQEPTRKGYYFKAPSEKPIIVPQQKPLIGTPFALLVQARIIALRGL